MLSFQFTHVRGYVNLLISRSSFGVRLKNSVLDLQPLTRFQTAILMRVQDVFFGSHFRPQLLSVQDVKMGVISRNCKTSPKSHFVGFV